MTIGKMPIRHLLWAENPETLCGLLDFAFVTDSLDDRELCRSCKRVQAAGKRKYITDLREDD